MSNDLYSDAPPPYSAMQSSNSGSLPTSRQFHHPTADRRRVHSRTPAALQQICLSRTGHVHTPAQIDSVTPVRSSTTRLGTASVSMSSFKTSFILCATNSMPAHILHRFSSLIRTHHDVASLTRDTECLSTSAHHSRSNQLGRE